MLDEAYDHFEVVLDEFIDVGAAVLTAGHAKWRGKASGVQGEPRSLPRVLARAKKVLRTETFTDRAEALEAVGLSEQDAHADS